MQIPSQQKARKSGTRLLAGWKNKADDMHSQIIPTESMGTINDTMSQDDEDFNLNDEENQMDHLKVQANEGVLMTSNSDNNDMTMNFKKKNSIKKQIFE